jgi:cytidylate kinase
MIITIDWFSRTGKGTTAKWVAHLLWYTYLDTWAMYRAATLYAMRHGLLEASDQKKADIVWQLDLRFKTIDWVQHTFMQWEDVEEEIRSTSLALQMKPITICKPLRKQMVALQQDFWKNGNIVCDGRDAATHIFPDAELKVFLVCDLATRVQRRKHQLDIQGIITSEADIEHEITTRDTIDYLWPDAVNMKAHDARELDTSHLTIDQQIAQVVAWAKELSS